MYEPSRSPLLSWFMIAIPAEIVAGRRDHLQREAALIRRELESNLQRELEQALDSLPEALRCMTLRQFLSLLALQPEAPLAPPSKRKKTIMGLSAEEVQRMSMSFDVADPGRRVTRSMAAQMRKESLAGGRESLVGPVPATPRLYPGLPETPAAIRHQLKQQQQQQPGGQPRPIRIAGSTIRATNIAASLSTPKPKPGSGKAVNPAVQNLIHMELSDGKTLDLDLTRSPGSLFTGIGAEKAGEVKEWLSQYASAFTSFIKRLGA